MKKIIISFSLCVVFSSQVFAWSELKSEKGINDDEINHTISCDDGRIRIVVENTFLRQYFGGNSHYDTLNEAAKAACSE